MKTHVSRALMCATFVLGVGAHPSQAGISNDVQYRLACHQFRRHNAVGRQYVAIDLLNCQRHARPRASGLIERRHLWNLYVCISDQ